MFADELGKFSLGYSSVFRNYDSLPIEMLEDLAYKHSFNCCRKDIDLSVYVPSHPSPIREKGVLFFVLLVVVVEGGWGVRMKNCCVRHGCNVAVIFIIGFNGSWSRYSMEHEEKNDVTGEVPEFGAIFMSNMETKRECFRRNLFGLPSSKANFVKQVKAGMVLFLFEFERKQLLGVFQASSDGAMNIVPDAFSSSGKQFPAQVCFTRIWYCSPLSENEFRDAIRENYFSAKKFNFGLSEDQVHRLLLMFNSKKINTILPLKQPAREVIVAQGKGGRRGHDDDRVVEGDRAEFKPDDVDNVLRPAIMRESLPLDRRNIVDNDNILMGNMEDENKVEYGTGRGCWTEGSWFKKRKVDDDGSAWRSNVTENGRFDDQGPGLAIRSEHRKGSPGSGRPLMDGMVKDECVMDINPGYGISSGYPRRLYKGSTVADDCRLPLRGDGSSRPVVSNLYHDELLSKIKLDTDDGRLLINNRSVAYEHNRDNGLGPVAAKHRGKHLRNNTTDDSWFSMQNRLENAHKVVDVNGPVISNEYYENSLDGVRRATDGGRFSMGERKETEHNISYEPLHEYRRENDDRRILISDRVKNEPNRMSNIGPVISNDYSKYTSSQDRRVADGDWFRESDRAEDMHHMDSRLGPVSTDYTSLGQSKRKHVGYSEMPKVEMDYSLLPDQFRNPTAYPCIKEPQTVDRHNQTSHDAIITRNVSYDPEFPDFSHPQSSSVAGNNSSSVQNYLGNFMSPLMTKLLSYDLDAQTVDRKNQASHDATVARNVPYNREVPDLSYRRSPSTVSGYNYSSVRNSMRNLVSSTKTKLSSYDLEAERCFDVASVHGSKVSSRNTFNCHDSSLRRTINPFSNAGYSENNKLSPSPCGGYKGLLYSKPDIASLPSSSGEINGKQDTGSFSFGFGSRKNLPFAFEEGFAAGSQGNDENMISRGCSEAFCAKEHSLSFAGWSHKHYGASSEDQGLYRSEKDLVNPHYYGGAQTEHFSTDIGRTSVFSRLSMAPEVREEEEEEDNDWAFHKFDDMNVAASVDEVMDMLHENPNRPLKRKRKFKTLHVQSDDDGSVGIKKQATMFNRIENAESKSIVAIDALGTIEEDSDSLLEETRLVDFKRRSQVRKNLDKTFKKGPGGIKKNSDETCIKGSPGIARVKMSVEVNALDRKTSVKSAEDAASAGKLCKRRKLVRPVFCQKESRGEIVTASGIQNGHLSSQESSLSKDDTNGNTTCEDNNLPTRNVGSVDLTPISSDNNSNADGSPNAKKHQVQKILGSHLNDVMAEMSKDDFLLLNAGHQVPLTNKTVNDMSSSCNLGVISCCSHVQEPPPGLCP
ncbi:hypothetical protein RJ640_017270 [Escallonia rubra]|uniref:DCD domain-containing protein n=1 Tax=Escallonia rubra TaxID=112253 RepID=A0AA88RQL5_9ASTE|nr:hypothetical protein RJ640_017270 [Escallonia rubra]